MFGFITFLHVAFFLCIITPDCQFVYSTLLCITDHEYWVSRPVLISHWVLRTLFRLAKIILSKNYNSISGFLVTVPIQSGSSINLSEIQLNERIFLFFSLIAYLS